MSVGEQTILFTDVVQSTALYHRLGDQRAFQVVKDHFDVVFAVIRARRGAVIKTIGDAVMAAFCEPEQALEAAIEMHRALEAASSELGIRVSLHQGSCLAVNLNTGMDYFGSVVNEAAKLQSLADSEEIALSETLVEQEAIAGILAAHELSHRRVDFKTTETSPLQSAAVVSFGKSQG